MDQVLFHGQSLGGVNELLLKHPVDVLLQLIGQYFVRRPLFFQHGRNIFRNLRRSCLQQELLFQRLDLFLVVWKRAFLTYASDRRLL